MLEGFDLLVGFILCDACGAGRGGEVLGEGGAGSGEDREGAEEDIPGRWEEELDEESGGKDGREEIKGWGRTGDTTDDIRG